MGGKGSHDQALGVSSLCWCELPASWVGVDLYVTSDPEVLAGVRPCGWARGSHRRCMALGS